MKFLDAQYPRTYENVLEPLETTSATFDYVWGVLKTLNLVKNDYFPSEGYNRIHDRARQARSKKYTSLPIYFACKVDIIYFVFSIIIITHLYFYVHLILGNESRLSKAE